MCLFASCFFIMWVWYGMVWYVHSFIVGLFLEAGVFLGLCLYGMVSGMGFWLLGGVCGEWGGYGVWYAPCLYRRLSCSLWSGLDGAGDFEWYHMRVSA